VAILLMGVVLFYWLAFWGTIWFWFNALFALLKGHFIRASIWFCLGGGMLLWWQGTEVIPHPWDFDEWLKGSAWVVGFAVILSLLRYFHKYRRTQASIPPEPASQVEIPAPRMTIEVDRPRKTRRTKKTINLVENSEGVWVPEGGEWK